MPYSPVIVEEDSTQGQVPELSEMKTKAAADV